MANKLGAARQRRILVLAGEGLDGFQGDPIVDHFASHTDSFFQEALGNAAPESLQRSLQYQGSSLAVRPVPPEQRKVCHTGAGHIVYAELSRVGIAAVFGQINDVFEFENDSTSLRVSEKWKAALRNVDCVCLSTTFVLTVPMLARLLTVLQTYRIPILMGGVLVNKLPLAVLKQLPFTAALRYEAEGRLGRLADVVLRGEDPILALADIPGLVVRRDGNVFETGAEFAQVDFPSIAIYPTEEWVQQRDGIHQYESVRGCPFRCEFCDYPFLLGNKKFRAKTAEQIHQEWVELAARGVRHIDSLDSLFTVPKKRMQRLAELLAKSGLARRLSWSCYARATELADRSFVRALIDAGCRYVFIGIESGAQTILGNMNKRTTVLDNVQAMHNCRELGLYSSCGILVGFPGEDAGTVEETRQMLRSVCSPSVHIFVWIPDFSKDSPVPIMRPGQLARYGIEGHAESAHKTISVWGQKVDMTLRTTWRHDSMTQEEALDHALALSETVRASSMECEDFSFAPYRKRLLHPSRLAGLMPCREQTHFLSGLSKLFGEFLAGGAGPGWQRRRDAWLMSSGIVPPQPSSTLAHDLRP